MDLLNEVKQAHNRLQLVSEGIESILSRLDFPVTQLAVVKECIVAAKVAEKKRKLSVYVRMATDGSPATYPQPISMLFPQRQQFSTSSLCSNCAEILKHGVC